MVTRSFVSLSAAAVSLLLAARLSDGTWRALVQAWYEPLLIATALLLALLAVVASLPALRSRERWLVSLTWRKALVASFIIAPVVIGLVHRPDPLGSSSLDLNRATGQDVFRFGESSLSDDPADRNVFEWAYAFQYEDRATLIGQPVDLVAFVHHPPGIAADMFHAARFVVACCISDATGYTLAVHWADAAGLVSDEWVHIKGAVASTQDGSLFIQARAVTIVDAPTSPYVYP